MVVRNIWSSRQSVRVGDDGRVAIAGQRYNVAAPPRTRLVHCQHTNGSTGILLRPPDKKQRPRTSSTSPDDEIQMPVMAGIPANRATMPFNLGVYSNPNTLASNNR